ncbi:tRNA pseudouridine(55) synthase TruB [Thauera linaloolentis]|uniref:tRNA pseudouridine synthase B n=1 Tax=Thauera linaloolentis (strain DSM 12138 / JCM 21573 / CCUG 41526 / CIP 105981 / IAM 15112 / NBRC 102519 / 47Lol) TaxID=1123367 RepID=N6ZEA8_THAL4|nr:tRNA pseudouridine(55) synthase TruB [Thauera linaloolentis]ENO90504.1 tRNA pseudouridine synthase B [Thauera linaloolentis 47Lol = DSM 12138]MCM8566363.1 tRNA pseudouridine(55) synthase TruB [Thauera linaloolentis]
MTATQGAEAQGAAPGARPRRPKQVQRKIVRRAVDGVLLLDKPQGMSSNGALQAARRLFNAAKAGHTGTLDPMASGLLPLTFGEATKFSQMLLDADKTYEAVVQLGIETDSGDADGTVLATHPVDVDRARLDAVLGRFRGDIEQVPPMYSALKRDGKALYEYARAGVEIEREARRVSIHALDLLAFADTRFTIRVACSKGTYIRSLAMDIGSALGCGAHLCALRRTRIGPFGLDGAVTLDALEGCAPEARDGMLAPADALVAVYPECRLDAEQARGLLQGRVLTLDRTGVEGLVRVYGPRGFLGLGQWQEGGRLAARRLIATDGGAFGASA